MPVTRKARARTWRRSCAGTNPCTSRSASSPRSSLRSPARRSARPARARSAPAAAAPSRAHSAPRVSGSVRSSCSSEARVETASTSNGGSPSRGASRSASPSIQISFVTAAPGEAALSAVPASVASAMTASPCVVGKRSTTATTRARRGVSGNRIGSVPSGEAEAAMRGVARTGTKLAVGRLSRPEEPGKVRIADEEAQPRLVPAGGRVDVLRAEPVAVAGEDRRAVGPQRSDGDGSVDTNETAMSLDRRCSAHGETHELPAARRARNGCSQRARFRASRRAEVDEHEVAAWRLNGRLEAPVPTLGGRRDRQLGSVAREANVARLRRRRRKERRELCTRTRGEVVTPAFELGQSLRRQREERHLLRSGYGGDTRTLSHDRDGFPPERGEALERGRLER